MASLQYLARPRGPRAATVVFIHGLGGHGYNTWRRNSADLPWPIWLAEDLRGVAVATISYEASTSNWTGRSLSLEERAKSLFPLLKSALGEDEAPIIFVCHSLGGLVLKQLIVMAASGLTFGEEAKPFLKRIAGIAFYATPHGGSHYGDLADQLRFFVWPTPTMQCLSQAGSQVHLLNEQYRNWAAANPSVQHLILYETQKSIFGWIVKSRDADPGIPNAQMQPGEADHFKIFKPFDRADARYTLCRDLVASIARRANFDPTPTAENLPIIPDPLPALPPSEPIIISQIFLRAMILLLVCYVGYRGMIAVYADPFRLRIEQSLQAKGASPEQSREISNRIAKDLRERKIGDETFEHFLDRGDLQVTPDPEVIYKNFLSLANRYSQLEDRLKQLSDTKDPEARSLGDQATTALKQGDIQTAEEIAKALELQRQLESQVQFHQIDATGSVEFLNDWDKQNIVIVNIPELASVGAGTTDVKFYKPAAKQLKAAFDEIQQAGLMGEIHEWCGSYSPRVRRGANALSAHAFGTAFDINCSTMPMGRPVELSKQPKFVELIKIFRKHGFLWGGMRGGPTGVPDPMHFQLYRIEP